MPQIELLKVNQYVYLFKLRVEFLCRMKMVIVETAAAAAAAAVVVVDVVVLLLYLLIFHFIVCSVLTLRTASVTFDSLLLALFIIRFKPR